ncbi:MAG: amidohydrolase family protein [Deltaproteobacteria bacterium]|nr:amidohydrolase family protein [Deltaproteobacteria bacterium]MDQ3299429.1 amidohydrolase family protein [Myxococcota bacterium]
MFDLKITGATIVDGTGRAAYQGDVAVTDGRIVAVGTCDGPARRTLDARGAHVLPGFVDIHTHYDGQVSWDEELTPSSLHGVTTCVMGSCGVGFAPVRPGREAALVELMEGVEDIPGAALAEGIPWGWESFADYMAVIGAMPHAIDFLVQVPHDPLRMYVMGERAVADELATDDDIAQMRGLLRAALEAGAAGFSTGRSDNHRTARGAATPASEVDARELAGIAAAFAGLGHGVMQAVSDFDMMRGPERFDPEFDLLEQMAAASGGRPLSISTMQRDHAPEQWRRILARVEQAAARGLDLRCQVGARGIGVLLGLEATFHPFMGFPAYKAIAHLPLAERVARMREPELRARMLAETSDKIAGDGTPIPPLADFFLANLSLVAMRLYRMAALPDYEPKLLDCLAAEASRAGQPVLARIYDALLEDDGKALLYFPIYNYSGMNLDAVREMLLHPRALVGLGDAGAHVGTVCDASMPTYLLSHWARDRANGIPLERVVQMQAHDTARFIGLTDRGTIEVGMRADLNVVELARVGLPRPVMQCDLPAGGRRLVQRAEGYIATFVAGVAIAEHGELTGARPGQLVRMGAPR